MARQRQRETALEKILKKLYYDPNSPASYGGKKVLETEAKNELKKSKLKRKNVSAVVEKWLENQPTYTLHKLPRKNFSRRRVMVTGINEQWQADLADLQAHAKDNDKYKYILMIIDCFSRKAWARPLKDKSGKNVSAAFNDIFQEQDPPLSCQTDHGLEFYNKDVKVLFQKLGIRLFSTKDPMTKASMVERLNRTMKRRMYGYFYAKRTKRWVDVLQDLINSYNNKKHSVIKMAPNQVNASNANIVYKNNLHNRGKRLEKKPGKFQVNDLVRITAAAHIFKKKYLPQWTEEIFSVHNVTSTTPVVYVLKDMSGEVILGTFYAEELQKVTAMPEVYEIQDILQQKGNMLLVSWYGYPKSMSQWIKKSSLRKL